MLRASAIPLHKLVSGNPLTRKITLRAKSNTSMLLHKRLTRQTRYKSTNTTSPLLTKKSFIDSIHAILLKPRTLPLPRWISPRHFSITISELCGHSSFILVALSYSVDDFLMLRIIAVAGSTSMLFFTYFHPHGRVLWLPFKWNILFIAINAYRIGKALKEEYMAKFLSEELINLRKQHLTVVKVSDFAKLFSIGHVESFHPGNVIIDQGEMNPYVRLIISGRLDCMRDDLVTYHIEKGEFVSEAGLHAGLELQGPVESCAKLVVSSDLRCIRWERTELTKFLKKNESLNRSIQSAISFDIVRKLKGQRQLLINGETDDAEKWTLLRKEQSEHRYKAILQNILSRRGHLGVYRGQIQRYRIIHHIDDLYHNRTLAKCGWTPQEYDSGFKHDEGDSIPLFL